MSDSSMRVNPSIEEPSNWISPSSALANCELGHLDVLDDAEDVGERKPHEPHPLGLAVLEQLLPGHAPSKASNFANCVLKFR